ncbi:CDP-glycerol glycerophosphotransferase family protein [Virgibacillus sp. NKC19-3]|uniref:CDP-glycerol glycerophosphotransferase family protein n=1 Tax=Virgibacillus saliphilus TaxID=2831674 RepID=UPI001C9B622C|nr:CDP-glycerol glycerophosphotransferase family protein [Virgibacillus sp. NKC19-3]MBY7144605.1 CDP-glycerol glycerophosphotransferase family protein [Virgibacillus sp. NKC19-3]
MKIVKKIGAKANMFLRSSKVINSIYYYIGTLILNILKLFVRTQENLILFVSFGGKYYNDSPKAIYEAMIKDQRFKNCEFVWAFKNPKNIDIPGNAKLIKNGTLEYFLISLKARVWISNAPIERRLNYKDKNTYFLCTWHGTPIKKLGEEISNLYERTQYDAISVQGEFDVKIFERAFNMQEGNLVRSGLPRNDILSSADRTKQVEIKGKFNIPHEKKVILYCPTYRDWQDNFMSKIVDFKKWKDFLGDNYVVLYRAHSKVVKSDNIIANSDFVYDMSNYHDLNDLMIASDILVSDYSSTFFDYSILDKPMYCYAYDYDEYASKRGIYFDIRKELPGGSISEDELLDLIRNKPYEEVMQTVRAFRGKFVEYYGNGSIKLLDEIHKKIH